MLSDGKYICSLIFVFSSSVHFLSFFSLEHFLKVMERDAEERRVKRMAKMKHATGDYFCVPEKCYWICCSCCFFEQIKKILLNIALFASINTALKHKGNEAYAQEDYETAVKYYSDGLAEVKDMKPLYTNRAQVSIFSLGVFVCINIYFYCLKCLQSTLLSSL